MTLNPTLSPTVAAILVPLETSLRTCCFPCGGLARLLRFSLLPTPTTPHTDFEGQDYADGMRALFSPAVISVWVVVTMIVACLGGLIGRFLLRKHFAKAGVA